MRTEVFWVSKTWRSSWQTYKRNDMLEPVGWVARRRRIGAAGWLWVSRMELGEEKK